jgi:adenylate cyclase class 2
MAVQTHHREIEIKLSVPDISVLRMRLKRLRAREITPRTYESNTLYDTPKGDLRRHGQMIRIRIERRSSIRRGQAPEANAPAILTYKGPARPRRKSKTRAKGANPAKNFKVRNEEEVSFNGADRLEIILRALGLYPVFSYEKFRTTYVLRVIRGLKIELDETPIGTFLELEGPVGGINRAARLLGYTKLDYITGTYGSLYLAYCRRRGQKPGDMLFQSEKKSHERTLFP